LESKFLDVDQNWVLKKDFESSANISELFELTILSQRGFKRLNKSGFDLDFEHQTKIILRTQEKEMRLLAKRIPKAKMRREKE